MRLPRQTTTKRTQISETTIKENFTMDMLMKISSMVVNLTIKVHRTGIMMVIVFGILITEIILLLLILISEIKSCQTQLSHIIIVSYVVFVKKGHFVICCYFL